jgi:uncharacterized protein (DUF433 family)
MTDLIPLEISPATAGTSQPAVAVYRYLMRQPSHWLRQAFFLDRPKLPVSRVVEAIHANQQSIEEAARDWQLPVEAIKEALDCYQRFRDMIETDAAEELALSEELALRNSPQS